MGEDRLFANHPLNATDLFLFESKLTLKQSVSNNSVRENPLILVVDDDKSMRAFLRVALEQEGYQVLEAQDSATCLAAYQRRQPDAIFLSASVSEMNGFACCSALRTFPGSDRIPILTIAVLDEPDTVEQAFAAGATDYIVKPINWTVLRHRLRRLLQQSQLHQQLEEARQELQRLASLVGRYEGEMSI